MYLSGILLNLFREAFACGFRGRKRGFSLVEALVASLIVGYCLLPIVGTMQNAERVTQRISHTDKLRILARSRLNLETSAANNEQKPIDTTTTYHYGYLESGSDELLFADSTLSKGQFTLSTPSSAKEVVYEYWVQVEVDDDVRLISDDTLGAQYRSGLKGLKTVVVTATLKANGAEIDEDQSYSLLSLVTVPSISDDYVWTINAEKNALNTLDPVTYMMNMILPVGTPATYDDKMPIYVYPHPNMKAVITYDNWGPRLINLDNTSPNYLATATFYSIAPRYPITLSTPVTSPRSHYYENFYSAIRPDGARAFTMKNSPATESATARDGMFLFVDDFEENPSQPTGFSHTSGSAPIKGLGTGTVGRLTAGNDGFLYLFVNRATGNESVIFRAPMYGALSNYGNMTTGVFEAVTNFSDLTVVAIASSYDGQKTYVLTQGPTPTSSNREDWVIEYNSKPWQENRRSIIYVDKNMELTDMAISGDGAYLCLLNNKSSYTRINLYNVENDLRAYRLLGSLMHAAKPSGFNPGRVIYSPIYDQFIISSETDARLLILDVKEFAAGNYQSKIPDERVVGAGDAGSTILHHSVRYADLLYIAVKKGNDYKLLAYDLKAKEFMEDLEISLQYKPTSIKLTPMGDRIIINYGVAIGYDVYDTKSLDLIYTSVGSGSRPNIVDYYPLNDGGQKDSNGKPTGVFLKDANNFELFYKKHDGTFVSESVDIGGWRLTKAFGLNSGGLLTLLIRDTTIPPSITETMIEWYERDSFGALKKANRWVSGEVACASNEKRLPLGFESFTTTTGPDTFKGFSLVYFKEKFPVNSKITQLNFYSDHSGAARYVTPMLYEKQSDDSYLVKDWVTTSIGVTSTGLHEEKLNWKYGGIIKNSNYYPGIWYGDVSKTGSAAINEGVLKYKDETSSANFYPDIGKNGTTGTDSSLGVANKLNLPVVQISSVSGLKRNYRFQFVAEEYGFTAAFPPQNVMDMVMTRDDRTLALVVENGSNKAINYYDFSASNFGLESRLDGMLVDYREPSLNLGATKVNANLSHKDPAFFKLNTAVTSKSTWNSLKDKAANFDEAGVIGDKRTSSNKRFLGYLSAYKDKVDGSDLYIESRVEAVCAYYAGTPNTSDMALTELIIDKGKKSDGATIEQLATHSVLLQLNQAGKGKVVVQKFNCGGSAPSGWTSFARSSTGALEHNGPTASQVDKGHPDIPNDLFSKYFYRDGIITLKLPNIKTDHPIKVDLIFMESYNLSANSRLFNIKLNDKEVEMGLDVFKEVGKHNVLIKTYYVEPLPTDELTILLVNVKAHSMISGFIVSYVERGSDSESNDRQKSGLFHAASGKKMQTVAKTGSGINAVNNMTSSDWTTLNNKAFTPFKFEPTYLGRANLPTAPKYWLNYSRDYHYPTLSVFTRTTTTNYGTHRSWLNKLGQASLFNTGLLKDVALSDVESKVYWLEGQRVMANNLLENINTVEEIASFTALEEPLLLATKPFNKYYENIATETFVHVATLPEARWGLNQAVVASGGIYIAGGADPGTNSYDKIYRFDVTSETVHHVGTLPGKMREHSMAAYDDCIYLFNGRWGASNTDATDTVVEFNVNTGSIKYSIDEVDVQTNSYVDVDLTPRGTHSSTGTGYTGTLSYNNEPDGNNKKVRWNNGPEETTDSVDKAFSNTEYWNIGTNPGGPPTPPRRYISIEYAHKVKVKKYSFTVDVANKKPNSHYFHASNDNISWTQIGPNTTVADNVTKEITTAKQGEYKYYKLEFTGTVGNQISIKNLKLEGDCIITRSHSFSKGMHRTRLDDLSSYEIMRNAACTTPYGIIVAGGKPNGGGSENATSTAMVYYPHSTEVADPEMGEKLFGLSRSITDLPNGGYLDSSMVWHKGKVYCFGGLNSYQTNAANIHLPAIFDFKTNKWTTATPPTAPHASPSVENWLRRRKAAAVSFGDEIFLFGGVMIENYVVPGVVAWNPETNGMRKVADNMPEATMNYSVSAVACGSHIYLIGGSSSNDSSSVTASNKIYRFTP